MTLTVKIKTNIPDIQLKMALHPKRLAIGLAIAIRKGAFLIERHSKRFAPVDTGRMRSSILSNIRPLVAIIRPNVDYAIYVHEGTRFISARPFMKQGRKAAQGEITRIFKKEVVKALK